MAEFTSLRGHHMVVDGIESLVYWGDWHYQPMFQLFDACNLSDHDTCGYRHRVSRPYTEADEKRWLAGVEDVDLDAAGHWDNG